MEFTDSGNISEYGLAHVDITANFALLQDSTIAYVSKYNTEVLLTKVDLNGNILKRTIVATDNQYVVWRSLLKVTPDGSIVVALYNEELLTPASLRTYSANLELVWQKSFGGPRIADILVLSSGSIIVGAEIFVYPPFLTRLTNTVIYGFSAGGDSLFTNVEALQQDTISQFLDLTPAPGNSFYAQTIFTSPIGGGYIRQLSAADGALLGKTRIPGNLATGSNLAWLPQRQVYVLGTLPISQADSSATYDLNVLDPNLHVQQVVSYPDVNYLTRGTNQFVHYLAPVNLVRITDDRKGGIYYTQKMLIPNRNQEDYSAVFVRLGHIGSDGRSIWSVRDTNTAISTVFRVQQVIPLAGNEFALCGGYDYQPLVKIYRVKDNSLVSDSVAAGAGARALAANSALRLTVFPNTASGTIHFTWPEQMDAGAQASIIDSRTGVTLRMAVVRKGTDDALNISALLPGHYFIVLRDASGRTATGGFIKL